MVGDYAVAESFLGSTTATAEPMAAVESNGTWAVATSVARPSADYVTGDLTGVSCDTSGNCSAVGWFVLVTTSTQVVHDEGFIITLTSGSGSWSAPRILPSPPGSPTLIAPTSISCASPAGCSVVETVGFGPRSQRTYDADVLTENGTGWSVEGVLGDVGTRPFTATSLSCPAVHRCVAVGETAPTSADLETSTDVEPAVAVENASGWGETHDLSLPVLSPLSDAGLLESVSCVATSECVAVGYALRESAPVSIPLSTALSSAGWSSISYDDADIVLGTSPSNLAGFTAVACSSVSTCDAVGVAAAHTRGDASGLVAFSSDVTPEASVSRPGSPTLTSVGQKGSVTTVHFVPPTSDGGSAIESFKVTARSPGRTPTTCVSAGLACSFSKLSAHHAYRITVVARNVAGSSPPSNARTYTIP